jgi:hypothetical protein
VHPSGGQAHIMPDLGPNLSFDLVLSEELPKRRRSLVVPSQSKNMVQLRR